MAKMKYYSSDKCCIITGTSPCALHHVKSRGAGGKDDAFNLMPFSAYHYNEIHVGGTKKFAEKYPEEISRGKKVVTRKRLVYLRATRGVDA